MGSSDHTLTRAPGLSARLASVTGSAADERLRNHMAVAALDALDDDDEDGAAAAAEADADADAAAAPEAPAAPAPAAVEKERAERRARAAETNRVSMVVCVDFSDATERRSKARVASLLRVPVFVSLHQCKMRRQQTNG